VERDANLDLMAFLARLRSKFLATKKASEWMMAALDLMFEVRIPVIELLVAFKTDLGLLRKYSHIEGYPS
jgi:hypothetical protein